LRYDSPLRGFLSRAFTSVFGARRQGAAEEDRMLAEARPNEYDDNVTALLELLWGRGFMTPGGEGNVRRIVEGIDLRNRRVLEIGSGLGGGSLFLADAFGARVLGLEVEAPLVERAVRYAAEAGLEDRIEFRLVEPGPLAVEDAAFDVVFSSGAIIHIEDKRSLFKDVLRVLVPGGVFTAYDWLKGAGPLSPAMHEWIRLEGLTFHLDTLHNYGKLLTDCGFESVTTSDASEWYAAEAQREYDTMRGLLYDRITEMIGDELRDHFLADWAAMVTVLRSGELRSGYFRGVKPV
jgi:phosphoethanolamine N-methyltransferase